MFIWTVLHSNFFDDRATGSIRITTLIELAQQYGVKLPAYTPEGLRQASPLPHEPLSHCSTHILFQTVFKDKFENLEDALKCFKYLDAVLQTPEALE